ncbi:MAG: hypothetical protein ACFFFK_06125 [Candidatus Thorarchaeota archaeon]
MQELSMTTIISPTARILPIIVLLTISVVILFRVYRGRFSEISNLSKFTFFLLFATDVFATIFLMTYCVVYTPYYFGPMLGVLTSGFFAALCIGGIVPLDWKRDRDDVWAKYLKERNAGLERQKKDTLTGSEQPS